VLPASSDRSTAPAAGRANGIMLRKTAIAHVPDSLVATNPTDDWPAGNIANG
jgi:hypothetical protein